ncbi:unnamed protein product [Linum tenue]|uniref:Uncharacterized protein n=1 Tax=Linum tenue TaxID=586396 RepID=A0AAV0RWN5_9ROSI|nr:unnamed protein product [Linum tenue]CAI0594022.1 unnamed protein product [Linum tenue]
MGRMRLSWVTSSPRKGWEKGSWRCTLLR